MNKSSRLPRAAMLFLYVAFTLIPLYWMLNTSLKTNEETLSVFTLWPQNLT